MVGARSNVYVKHETQGGTENVEDSGTVGDKCSEVPPASHLGIRDCLWGNHTLSAVFILIDFIISKPQDYLALISALTFSTGL